MISIMSHLFLCVGVFLSFSLLHVQGGPILYSPDRAHHLQKNLLEMLQQHVKVELGASYTYMAMAAYFGKESVNRPGFAKFFKESSEEEFTHAQKIIDYINQRGGALRIEHLRVAPPMETTWTDGVHALEQALELEGIETQKLVAIHGIATDDGHLTNFLESEFLEEQVNSMRELSGYYNNLRAMVTENQDASNKLAEYLFDRQLQGKKNDL